MKKKVITIMLLTAMYAALSTSCAPPRHLKPPPAPPGAPAH
ncbi:MAG: hypothetical protein ACTHMI_23205 [Mucilaginibacter sp.]|nr:hypothetical protein [Mucilaginibacter sp. L3T2-6]MDO3642112.1 hypothetical protein [Mucilaginibacter sp. L3T2-6]MDV6214606.1 hypothetical protein [Mucilaginibacter sp. L3T2-6]